MTTEAKIEANRANAQLSTGPATPEGKAISSRNAITHGLTAATVLLPGEDPAQYNTLAAGMLRDFNPFNTTEGALAQELIDLQWRLRRVPAIEARILSADSPDTRALNNISLHAARMKRQYSATLKEYQDMHAANSKRRQDLMKQAEFIYRADRILDRESTLALRGFDFTAQDLKSGMDCRQALADAKGIVQKYEEELSGEEETGFEDRMDDAA